MSDDTKVVLAVLEPALRYGAWCKETSASPDLWTPERPSVGQCAVTAVLLQDRLGGLLMRGQVGQVGHYWLKALDGTEIDLTRDQFDDFKVEGDVIIGDRAYVLSFPDTLRRFELLKSRVKKKLGVY